MSDHPSHKLDTYHDVDHKWVTFCTVCSREEENLSDPCPGKFVPVRREISCTETKKRLDSWNDNY